MANKNQTKKLNSKSSKIATPNINLSQIAQTVPSKLIEKQLSNQKKPLLENASKPGSSDSSISEVKSDRYYNVITPARFKILQKKAEASIKSGKTFLMRARWPIVRKTFQARGWVELYESHYNPYPTGISKLTYYDLVRNLPVRQADETLPNYTTRCERYILSRLIEHMPVSFTWSWVPNKPDFDHQLRHSNMIVNKLIVSPFVSNEGLARDLRQNLPWLSEENVLEVNVPRSYSTTDPEQMEEFLQNFRNTACISFLKYVIEKTTQTSQKILFTDHPATEIPYSALEFALQRCYELLNYFKHNDIDSDQRPLITDRDWDRFFGYYYALTLNKAQIRKDKIQSVDSILRNAKMVLEGIKPYWPQYNLDGYLNIWILKPADNMCGQGIHISNNLKKIKEFISTKSKTHKRMIVQKYIERPFTIYDTKFDLRQFFLITNVYPLVLWIYNESYIRFSSKPFKLEDFHESIHLTNNAIQRKYKVDPKRDTRLPRQNMWDRYTFQAYLRQIGKGNIWESSIYPQIKQAIIGTVLASQSGMIQRNNTFQLYGADFILCEDLKPWIIEINGCPNLYLTTNVTSRIVPQCVEDIFKVVVDRKSDPTADTGNFELIYSQSIPPVITKGDKKLFIAGKQLLSPTMQVRREMYQQLIPRSFPPDPRGFLPLSTTAKPITRRDEAVDPNIRDHFEDNTSVDINVTATEKLEEIKQNLKKITQGS